VELTAGSVGVGSVAMPDPPVDADAFNAFEAAGWEQQVAGYDDFFGPITTRLVAPLLDAAAVGPASRVLDVASGPGYVASVAAEREASVVGLDVSEGMVERARSLHPQLDFRLGSAEALPFDDSAFDAVVANFLMLHLGRPERAAAEFARVLRPGGRVALTVWDAPDQARFIGVLVEAVAAAGAAPPQDMPVGPPIFRFADEPEFTRVLSDQGLVDVRVETIAYSHVESSAEALWSGLLGGTVRVSALILRQSAEMQHRIRAAFDEIVQPYESGNGLELPVSVKLASAGKP
jgi:ubiquinone/menaquinone biosynthesis C-methylase UbiE